MFNPCTPVFPIISHSKCLFHLHHYNSYGAELKEFIVLTVTFLLKHTFFTFDKVLYLQIRVVSMGAKFSPSLATLYVGWWEEKWMALSDTAVA